MLFPYFQTRLARAADEQPGDGGVVHHHEGERDAGGLGGDATHHAISRSAGRARPTGGDRRR